jgi:type IV pilus assembly protein PilF
MRRLEAFLACMLGLALAGFAIAQEGTPLPREARNHLATAQSYLQQGDLANAALRADQAVRAAPKAPETHLLRGIVHDAQGDQAKAQESFDKARKYGPANATVHNSYGVWLCKHGRFDEAEKAFAVAMADRRLRSGGKPPYFAGLCALKAGKMREADQYLREVLALAPNDRVALLALAKANLALGNLLDARAFMQRCDARGSNPDVLKLGIQIEEAVGDERAAAAYRKRLQDEFPAQAKPTGEGASPP